MATILPKNSAFIRFQPAFIFLSLLSCSVGVSSVEQYPQGYYPFEESPAKIPPVVRKPPYLQTQVKCQGVGGQTDEQTLDNLCGDLNKGYLPVNPIGQNVLGVSYPFELLKNKTLEFFSKTLPILKADDTLPKVAKYQDSHIMYNPAIFNSQPNTKIKFFGDSRNSRQLDSAEEVEEVSPPENSTHHRERREASPQGNPTSVPVEAASQENIHQSPREARSWCKDSFGVFCMLFNALKGNGEGTAADNRIGSDPDTPDISMINSLDQPMTPCPSAVEYVTPVFAKNYQGVWRYVVQIPYEGYFTQTVEVVKCLSTKCEFLEGSCLASPRWVSLLVAEIYYPDTYFPSVEEPTPGRTPVRGSSPSGFLQKRSGQSSSNCDGEDELGCFNVRLYYDWFLIPGSCKCWKNDFFAQYTRK